MYRRGAIAGVQPLLSHHFNLTVELPLKCIIRGYRYTVLPNSWKNRKQGVSKLRIKEMGSRYLFIILYCWLEQVLSRGDYTGRAKKSRNSAAGLAAVSPCGFSFTSSLVAISFFVDIGSFVVLCAIEVPSFQRLSQALLF